MMIVRNCTIGDNDAQTGGGIYIDASLSVITHSTIAYNIAQGGGDGGGLFIDTSDTVIIRNTIVGENWAGFGSDIAGSITSQGHNLISDENGGSGYDNTDILNVDPMLDHLVDNGGLTPTRALLPGSPAIDAGDNTDAPEWDQRGPGFPRIVNGAIDIGAFEVQAMGAPTAPDHLAILITANLAEDD